MKKNYEFQLNQKGPFNPNLEAGNQNPPPNIMNPNQNQQNMFYSTQNMPNNNGQYQQVSNPNQFNGTQNMGQSRVNNGMMNPNGNANGALSK